MNDVFVLGAAMTAFDRHPSRTHKDLAREAVEQALGDAGLEARPALDGVWFGSCTLPAWGQANLGGHVVIADLQERGFLEAPVPVVNVEAGCATGTVAFQGAVSAIRAGEAELCLAVGVDKTFVPDDPRKTVGIFLAALDQLDPDAWRAFYAAEAERTGLAFEPHPMRVIVLDVVALHARHYLQTHGVSRDVLAAIASKNAGHGARNPKAQKRKARSVEEILAEDVVCDPFSKSMCAPISDGAAAILLGSRSALERLPLSQRERAVPVLACALGGSRQRRLGEESSVAAVARRAYQRAGIGPEQVQLAEVHDATAFAELELTESLGLCAPGQGAAFASSGATSLGGSCPVNVSGGLEAKGHPLAASGLAQLFELTRQLRGEGGERQVPGARLALQQNGGGLNGFDVAASAVTILGRA